jgi:hypothetical protein
MNIIDATRSYDSWLQSHTLIVARDLQAKHVAMAEGPLPMLRATFYRFMQLWKQHAGVVAAAPRVLAIGDLHIENFGTWRDSEGRLIWGVNDFDEAHLLPFTLDLVRLATSVLLAIKGGHLSVRAKQSCAAIMTGYVEGLERRGRPFVLAEHNTWLWRLAVDDLRDPKLFWHDQEQKCGPPRPKPPAKLVSLVRRLLPKGIGPVRVFQRTAGKGSLGRRRLLFRGEWKGGVTAREAKALAPSACAWATGESSSRVRYREILKRAVRAPDPALCLRDSWLIRRLAPDCSKIDLAHLPGGRDESKLLHAMGFEAANIHLGTPGARGRILSSIRSLGSGWLPEIAAVMADAVERDWQEWRAQRA